MALFKLLNNSSHGGYVAQNPYRDNSAVYLDVYA